MRGLQLLSQEDVRKIANDYLRGVMLMNVVDISTPYLRNENGRVVYKTPLIVKADDRTIDMVGLAEVTIDPYSGKILETVTQEEIDINIDDLVSKEIPETSRKLFDGLSKCKPISGPVDTDNVIAGLNFGSHRSPSVYEQKRRNVFEQKIRGRRRNSDSNLTLLQQ